MDPLAHEFPWQSPYAAMNNNPIYFIDPDGRASMPPSTFLDGEGNVVGGTVDDGDKGVYKVSGLTKDNFNIENISQYKEQGKRIGETLSLYSFYNPASNGFMGSVNTNSTEAADLISSATTDLQTATDGMNMFESGKYYGVNAKGAGARFDLKTYGMPNPKKVTDSDIYRGSIFKSGVIMTRRDAGNYFAGKAASMIGLSKNVMLSGYGGFASSNNNLNLDFGFKSILNLVDNFFMGSALDFVPGNQNGEILQYIPPFSEYKGSRDLQIRGFDEN